MARGRSTRSFGKLSSEHLVHSTWEKSRSPARRIYEISDLGKAGLSDYVRDAADLAEMLTARLATSTTTERRMKQPGGSG